MSVLVPDKSEGKFSSTDNYEKYKCYSQVVKLDIC